LKNVVIDQTKIPKDIYSGMKDMIRLGFYSSKPEIISKVLKKVLLKNQGGF
jgi:hypothetical protein